MPYNIRPLLEIQFLEEITVRTAGTSLTFVEAKGPTGGEKTTVAKGS